MLNGSRSNESLESLPRATVFPHRCDPNSFQESGLFAEHRSDAVRHGRQEPSRQTAWSLARAVLGQERSSGQPGLHGCGWLGGGSPLVKGCRFDATIDENGHALCVH